MVIQRVYGKGAHPLLCIGFAGRTWKNNSLLECQEKKSLSLSKKPAIKRAIWNKEEKVFREE